MCVGPLAGNSNTPSPAPLPPPPPVIDTTDKDSPESVAARLKEEQRAKLARGGASTILSSPLGDTSNATVQKATLLGQTA